MRDVFHAPGRLGPLIRDRVGRDSLAVAEEVDISSLLKTSFLPSKILVLLGGACLVWIGILSLAFMLLTGKGIAAGWIFAGALFLALTVWVIVMFKEFIHAMGWPGALDDDQPDDCDLDLTLDRSPVRLRSGYFGSRSDRAFARTTHGRRMKGLTCEIRPRRRAEQPSRSIGG